MLYNDYIGPARLRLNLPEVAPELKWVWHPWSKLYWNIGQGLSANTLRSLCFSY